MSVFKNPECESFSQGLRVQKRQNCSQKIEAERKQRAGVPIGEVVEYNLEVIDAYLEVAFNKPAGEIDDSANTYLRIASVYVDEGHGYIIFIGKSGEVPEDMALSPHTSMYHLEAANDPDKEVASAYVLRITPPIDAATGEQIDWQDCMSDRAYSVMRHMVSQGVEQE